MHIFILRLFKMLSQISNQIHLASQLMFHLFLLTFIQFLLFLFVFLFSVQPFELLLAFFLQLLDTFVLFLQFKHLIPFSPRSLNVLLKLSKDFAGVKFEKITVELSTLEKDWQTG